jgi:tellurite resistance protein
MAENPYAPPSATTSPTAQIADAFPNPDERSDRNKVLGAGITLIILGALQLLAGLVLAGGGLRLGGSTAQIIGILTVAEGAVTLTLGIFTLKNSYGAAMGGLVLACIGLGLNVLSLNMIAIAIRGAVVALVARGVSALRSINNRVAAGTPATPLTAYYHELIPIMVRVMAADGHLDRRERKKIGEVCDAMRISRYEQHRLIGQASRSTTFDVRASVQRYLQLARQIRLPTPEEQLLMAAIAVAGADGVFEAAEEQLIKEIGAAAGMSAEDIEWRVTMAKAKLGSLDSSLAREILNVDQSASPEAIETSYQTLCRELAPEAYGHLGQGMSGFVRQRVAVLDRAKDLLSPSAAS